MIDFRIYQNVILDFDGVILDSNFVKEKAIRKVAKKFLNDVKSEEFVNFFISNNGLPREIKIKKYIDDSNLYNEFLKSYNEILSQKLNNAKLTTNAKKFFEMLHFYNLPIYILSGGDEKEVISSLEYNKLLSSFQKVMGGPKTKYENMNDLHLNGKTLYIGDSKIDYEVAKKYSFDFVYMYQYTQFREWRKFFKHKNEVKIIKNFKTLTYGNY
jgi:phosphoglycolate phosphatase-like HAD superfamily hydrolase